MVDTEIPTKHVSHEKLQADLFRFCETILQKLLSKKWTDL